MQAFCPKSSFMTLPVCHLKCDTLFFAASSREKRTRSLAELNLSEGETCRCDGSDLRPRAPRLAAAQVMKRYTLQSGDSTSAELFIILTRLQSPILLLLLLLFLSERRYSFKSEPEHKGKVKEVENPPLEFTDVSTCVWIHLFQLHGCSALYWTRAGRVRRRRGP